MGSYTTRLNLYLPGGGSTGLITPDEAVDIDKLNDNFKKIDVATGVLFVTSTTRPFSPADGQQIYETDTKKHQAWKQSLNDWVDLNGNYSQLIPAGTIWEFAGATLPSGWAWADGGTSNRITDAGLFAAIGTTYGVGDGSTTFNRPNRKGRVGVGVDTAQTEFNVLGKAGGAKTHTLTTAEMPAHNHAVYGQLVPRGTGANFRELGTASGNNSTTVNTGGDGAHNNLQPYVSMNYMIKL